PQTAETVNECLQLRRCVAKPGRSAEYDAVRPLYVGMCWRSVLGAHSFAAVFPTRNMRHHGWRNYIGHPAKPHLTSGIAGTCGNGLCQGFHGTVTRVKRYENVCFRICHRTPLSRNRGFLKIMALAPPATPRSPTARWQFPPRRQRTGEAPR